MPQSVTQDSDKAPIFTRATHGCLPVLPEKEGHYVVWFPDGPKVFPTKGNVLSALYQGKPPKSWDEYFRTGSYSGIRPVISTLEIFRARVAPVVYTTPKSLGIDLADWHQDVRKIFYAHFYRRCSERGYDDQDVLQEIYRGLLARNNGICPFDASKSSRGHYIYIVCTCVLANYARREGRRSRKEQVGIKTFTDGDVVESDASQVAQDTDSTQDEFQYRMALGSLGNWIRSETELMGDAEQRKTRNVLRILPLLSEGHSIKEITTLTCLTPAEVTSAVQMLRSLTRGWANEEGLPVPQVKARGLGTVTS